MDKADCEDVNEIQNGHVQSDESIVERPEGGWGWVIVFSAFIFNVITDGCAYSFGVLYTHLVDYFGASRSKTAWIGSVFNSAPLLCGPIASFVTNRYGFRKASIIGGAITFLGFFTSVFAPSIEVLCVTYGLVAGFGVSLPYLVSSVIVATYFRRKLTLASGLAECGAGVGTLIFAPLLEYLISTYGWRGAILILSGIVSNTIVCAAVYRPLHSKSKYHSRSELIIESSTTMIDKENIDKEDERYERQQLMISESEPVDFPINHSSDASPRQTFEYLDNENVEPSERTSQLCKGTYNSSSLLNKIACCNSNFILHIINTNVSILLNWKYFLFAVSNFILYFWYDVPYVFTVDRAVELGESDYDASFVVSAIGILHTIGNVVCGAIGDRNGVNKSCFYSVSLWICGVALGLVPLFRQLIPTGVLVGIYGLLSAATEALKMAIVVDIVGLTKLTDAYGLLMFLQGIANLTGPPVAGWLFDISGSYDHTFLTAGISLVVAGILSMIPACGSRKSKS